MKTQFENITPDANSSFKLLLNPRLSDLFYWHFHPEFELVYIEGANGTRHVGSHISKYIGSDLVLIGSNIPHLNFDYGVKTDYKKVVLQIHPTFVQQIFEKITELTAIKALFQLSQYGVAFSGKTKEKIGQKMNKFSTLSPFNQFLEVLHIFQHLAHSEERELLHDQPVKNQFNIKEQNRLRQVYVFIDQHYKRKIGVDEVAGLTNLTKAAFCRYFKKASGYTFTDFLNRYRIGQAKKLLLLGHNVSEACFESGFESLSYFNRIFRRITHENPLAFRNRHLR
ncbi:AraC family transcriptional regulator [Flexithrix dorotheae]|uniref:AraC family transcriptional regulator n=1 Tax=Flexithrix dorotheae TaxID=70993 RepID=UPI000361DF40|nr:AraC family transcriptional regulator [Flexithrix dorotheae]